MKIKNCSRTPARGRCAKDDAFVRHVRFRSRPWDRARSIPALFAKQPSSLRMGGTGRRESLGNGFERRADTLSQASFPDPSPASPPMRPSRLLSWTPLLPAAPQTQSSLQVPAHAQPPGPGGPPALSAHLGLFHPPEHTLASRLLASPPFIGFPQLEGHNPSRLVFLLLID